MEVTESGMLMEWRLGLATKAPYPMAEVLLGIMVDWQPVTRVLVAVSIMALHPFRLSKEVFPGLTVIAYRFE